MLAFGCISDADITYEMLSIICRPHDLVHLFPDAPETCSTMKPVVHLLVEVVLQECSCSPQIARDGYGFEGLLVAWSCKCV